MKDAITRIEQLYESLKPSQQAVAKYILENPQFVLSNSIQEVAKQCQRSEASIIRFCKELDFSGFKDLKMGLLTSLNELKNKKPQQVYQQLLQNTPLEQAVEIISSNNQQAIIELQKLVDYKKLREAIELMQNAQCIYTAGVGASALVAEDFYYKCQRINKRCEALTDSHQMYMKSVHLQKNDVVFLITYSGETTEIVRFAKLAKKNNVPIIALTSFRNSSIQALSSISLYVSNTEPNKRIGATSSRIAQLNMIDILFTCIARKDYHNSVELFQKTKEIVEKGGEL